MIFIVGGGLGLFGLLIAAAAMGTLARREPGRRFRVGGRGVRTGQVTFSFWFRRYFPPSLALCLFLIVLGLSVRAR